MNKKDPLVGSFLFMITIKSSIKPFHTYIKNSTVLNATFLNTDQIHLIL